MNKDELDLLVQYVSNLYHMLGIPALVCKDGEQIAHFRSAPVKGGLNEFFESIMTEIAGKATESYIGDLTDSEFLLYGVSKKKGEDVAVFFGPIRTDGITITQLKTHFSGDSFFSSFQDGLYSYMTTLPVLNGVRFRGFFSMLDMFVNRECRKFRASAQEQNLYPDVREEELSYIEKAAEYEKELPKYHEEERRILFYVKNGMVDQIDEFLKDAPLFAEVEHRSTVRRIKDDVILALGLISRVAIDAGVDGNLCLHMVDIFMDRAEGCSSTSQLRDVRYRILRYFTEKIGQLQTQNVTNPIVLRIMKYVVANVDRQITCAEIGEAFHINRSYVSTCFKKETGMGLVDYINLQKIIRAKQLLKFTKKTLVEITYALSFSSQAYFTKIFKSIVGMTPQEYRETTK